MRKRYKIPLIVVAVLVGFMAFSAIYYQLVIVPVVERAADPEPVEIRTVVDEAVDLREIYKDVLRYPEKYYGVPVKLTGEADNRGGVLSIWPVRVLDDRLVDGGRVVTGDRITVYGLITGINIWGGPDVDPLFIQLRGVAPTLEDCMKYDQALPGC